VTSSNPEHWTNGWISLWPYTITRGTPPQAYHPIKILIGYETTLLPSEMPPSNNQTVEDRIKNMMEHQARPLMPSMKPQKETDQFLNNTPSEIKYGLKENI